MMKEPACWATTHPRKHIKHERGNRSGSRTFTTSSLWRCVQREIWINPQVFRRLKELAFEGTPDIENCNPLSRNRGIVQLPPAPLQWPHPRIIDDEFVPRGCWVYNLHRCIDVPWCAERGHAIEGKWLNQQYGGARFHL